MITNNIWEQSNEQANCNLCASDSPFFMPIRGTDMISLRLQIPYQYVSLNGGGLPIGANVSMALVDEIGTTTLCNYSDATNGQFLLSHINNATNKLAEYQIYAPFRLRDENNNWWSQYYFTAVKGDHINITGGVNGDNDCDFIYGYDDLPPNFYEVQTGFIVIPARTLPVNVTNILKKNNVVTTLLHLYTSAPACLPENYNCFRVKISVNFSSWGVVKEFYTKPFKRELCTDSVRINGTYPIGLTDCIGYYHQGITLGGVIAPNNLFLRIPADIEGAPSKITKSYNDRCYNYKTILQKAYRLKSDPIPSWFASEIENIIASQGFEVNNIPYISESEQILEESEVDNSLYQNLNISLLSCKCEKVFVC